MIVKYLAIGFLYTLMYFICREILDMSYFESITVSSISEIVLILLLILDRLEKSNS